MKKKSSYEKSLIRAAEIKTLHEYEQNLPKSKKYTDLYNQYKDGILRNLHMDINKLRYVWFPSEPQVSHLDWADDFKCTLFNAGVEIIIKLGDNNDRKKAVYLIYVDFLEKHFPSITYALDMKLNPNSKIFVETESLANYMKFPLVADWFYCYLSILNEVREIIENKNEYILFHNEYLNFLKIRQKNHHLYLVSKKLLQLKDTKLKLEIDIKPQLDKLVENVLEKKTWPGTIQDFAVKYEKERRQGKYKGFTKKYTYNMALKDWEIFDKKNKPIDDYKIIAKALENWKRYFPEEMLDGSDPV